MKKIVVLIICTVFLFAFSIDSYAGSIHQYIGQYFYSTAYSFTNHLQYGFAGTSEDGCHCYTYVAVYKNNNLLSSNVSDCVTTNSDPNYTQYTEASIRHSKSNKGKYDLSIKKNGVVKLRSVVY